MFLIHILQQSVAPIVPVATQVVTQKSVSLFEMIAHNSAFGNIVLIILFALFILAVYLFLERYFVLKKAIVPNSKLIDNVRDFVSDAKIDAALELCKRTNTPEARMIHKGLMRIGRPTRDISDAIENQGQLEIYRLEKNVNILATISGSGPLLGLLGTVVGMIFAFSDMANSSEQVSAKVLSSGIYVALTSTAGGVFVGVVAYVFYNLMVSKVEKAVFELQSSATDFLDLINKPVA